MSSPLAADSAADTALETGTENQRGRAMRGPVDGGDTAMPELLAPRPSKGKERLDLVAGMEPGAAPNVVEIPAGPPLVRVGTERTAGAFATPPFSPAPPLETSESVEPSATENENETPFAFHSPPYRPHSPPTVSTVRRRKERSREPGHVRRHSGHRGQMMSDAVRPLAGVEGRESPGPAAERARSPAPEQRPHANAGGVPPAAAAAGAARPQQQQQGANAQVPGPREAFLAIDVRTVRTHVYHLVAHTLLLPFVVALIAEYIVFPITALIYSYVVLVSPGHYLVIDFLRWLGRELLRSRASRSVMAGVCYGIGREVSVRWWRGRMKQERGDFTVEDWKPESEQAANASNANANAV